MTKRKFVSLPVCGSVWEKREKKKKKTFNSRHEKQSYLDEWFAQSLFVHLQHNVPDLFIRQAERAEENCCCDGEREESYFVYNLLFFFCFLLDCGVQRDISAKRHFGAHRSSNKMTTDPDLSPGKTNNILWPSTRRSMSCGLEKGIGHVAIKPPRVKRWRSNGIFIQFMMKC